MNDINNDKVSYPETIEGEIPNLVATSFCDRLFCSRKS